MNYDPNQNQNFVNVNQGQDQMGQPIMNQPMMNQPMMPMMNNTVNSMQQMVNPNQIMMQQQQQWGKHLFNYYLF